MRILAHGPRGPGRRDDRDRPRGGSARVILAGVVVGIIGSAGFIWQGTNAAFTASTQNGVNSWTSGTVVVADDDSGSALFSAGPVVPGDTGSRCIAVTYSGSVAATVHFYTSAVSGGLTPYLDVRVEEGAGAGNVGSAASCAGFSGTTVWSGRLDALGSTVTDFASGVGTFAPTGSGQTQVYRITWTVDPAAGDALQGTAATASFVWEAQS